MAGFVLGFPRDYEGPAKLTIKHTDGSIENFAYDIGEREFDIQRIDGLPKKMVTPDPAVMDRIKDDSRQAREARTERFTEEFLEKRLYLACVRADQRCLWITKGF